MKKGIFYFNLVRLSLFQTAFGVIYVLLNDTLNRVMTIELGVSATIVFTLINLKEILSLLGIKVWAGNTSDKTSLFGYKRFPYIAIGLIACSLTVMLAPYAALQTQTNFLLGIIQLVLVFTVFGFGLHVSLTTYYALIADYAGEENIGKVASISWSMMVLSIIICAKLVGDYLDPFSFDKLSTATQTIGFISIAIGLLMTFGIESRNDLNTKKSEDSLTFAESIQLIRNSPQTKLFAFYIFISIFAAFGTELVMEPFGADVFGMSVSETTKIKPVLGGAQLILMLLTGFLINRVGKKQAILAGNWISTAGFIMIIIAGTTLNRDFLRIAFMVLGAGFGISNIGNITLMMTFTAGRSGLYLGLWGTAQSLAFLLAGTGLGAVRDILTHLSPNPMFAYGTIFIIEIIAFTVSTWLIPRISQDEFESEAKFKAEDILAVAAD